MNVTNQAGQVSEPKPGEFTGPQGARRPKSERIEYPSDYTYLSLDRCGHEVEEADVVGDLVRVEAHSKYTLKGLGRQYSAGYNADYCLWCVTMGGSCRTGRINTEIIVAVVNAQNPLILWHREGESYEESYIPAGAESPVDSESAE